jgi:basic membrane protein A and related proteins
MTQNLTRRALLAVSLAAAVVVTACNKAPEPKPAAPAAAPTAAAPAPAPKAEPLKIGFIYVGPVGDAGWTFAHDNGRKAVEAEFGDKVKTQFVETVKEGPDAERVIRELVSQGNKMVFATSFGYGDFMAKVAGTTADVRFEHATGFKTSDNLRVYDSRTYEGAYLAGVIAGKMTKTNVLGVVGSIQIPEVIRNINSFTLGAQSVNPKVTTKVVWVGDWFNPPKETEAATSLINQKADVLFQNTDSTAVLQTAEKMGKLAFGWDSDMSKFGPGAHLASAVINWGPYYKRAVKEALDGSWKTGSTWWGIKEGAIDLVSVSDKIPEETRKLVAERKEGLKNGSFSIWKGPIVDQNGKEVLAKDAVADDKFLGGINYYIKGVEGKLAAK